MRHHGSWVEEVVQHRNARWAGQKMCAVPCRQGSVRRRRVRLSWLERPAARCRQGSVAGAICAPEELSLTKICFRSLLLSVC